MPDQNGPVPTNHIRYVDPMSGEGVTQSLDEAWSQMQRYHMRIKQADDDLTLEDTLIYASQAKAMIEADYLRLERR